MRRPTSAWQVLLLLGFTGWTAMPARAQVDPGVKLQPFRLKEAPAKPARQDSEAPRAFLAEEDQPIRVAYYRGNVAPLRAEPAEEAAPPLERTTTLTTTQRIVSYGRGPTVPGDRAALRNGVAYAPSRAPANVKNAIWAINTLRRKPYVWGGGHRTFDDRGYDCSGSVSYALHHAGLLAAPMPSSDFLRYGERGRGRWITVYARPGHTFAVIAGLRLDTTDMRNGGDVGPRWFVDGRDARNFAVRHPAGW